MTMVILEILLLSSLGGVQRAAAVIGYRHSAYTRTMGVPDTLTPVLIALAASMEHLHPLSLPPLAAGA